MHPETFVLCTIASFSSFSLLFSNLTRKAQRCRDTKSVVNLNLRVFCVAAHPTDHYGNHWISRPCRQTPMQATQPSIGTVYSAHPHRIEHAQCYVVRATRYTDFHKISVLISCNLVVLYAYIHTILGMYTKSTVVLPSNLNFSLLALSFHRNLSRGSGTSSGHSSGAYPRSVLPAPPW